MKNGTAKLILLILGTSGCSTKFALAVEPISIVISGPTTPVRIDSNIMINIILTNTSANDINLAQVVNDSDGELNYSIKVTDAKGNTAAETKYGIQMKGNLIKSRTEITLHQNESAEPETAVISKLFVLIPGHAYAVQVKREYPSGSGAWVKSNSIKLMVSK